MHKIEYMIRPWIYVLIGSIIIPACGGSQAAKNPDNISPVTGISGDREIENIKRDLQQLDSTLSAASAKVDNLIAAVTHINNRVEEFDLRLLKIESMVATSGNRVYSYSQMPLSPEVYLSKYKTGFQAFSASRYNDALSVFQKLVSSNPNNELSDNAQYWIGESYYGLEDYERALLEFEKVFTFPNNNKMDAAQLKLGICYLKLKNPAKAKEEFMRLVQFYPESEYIPLSNRLINNL